MILRKFNFDDETAQSKFRFVRTQHKSSWEHYSNCYNFVLNKIFNKGFRRNYSFNCQARAILFLIRHSFELTLKRTLESLGQPIPNTHIFNEIYSAFPDDVIIPEDFKKVVALIDLDTDGSCYRYYKNKETLQPFFMIGNRIELVPILKGYNKLPRESNLKNGEICEDFDYNNKRINWDLTFHMGECHNDGAIRTQYDEVIEFLVEGVLYDNYDFKYVYLPLLYLIRHSLELGLKSNLQYAAGISPEKVPVKEYDNIHSLAQLYNCFGGDNGYLSKLDLTLMSEDTKEQFDSYKAEYEDLNKVVHQLDTNSLYLRYPVDLKGNHHPLYINNEGFIKILKLYYLTDPFTSFTLDVLLDEGIN